MASFARKWLDGILENEELTAKEKAQLIMDGHIAVTDGLKEERDSYKADAEKAADLQKQLDDHLATGEDWKAKFENEHKSFEDFKAKTASEANAAKVRTAYKSLLAGEGISEKRLDGIVKVAEARGDLEKLKVDENGTIENADELKKAINEEWGEFVTKVSEKGAVVEKPLQTGGSMHTKEEIMAIKDTTARQKAISENLKLFGKG